MPIIKVEWFPGRSQEQKAKLAQALTQAMVEIGGAPLDHTFVIFQEVAREDWASGGKLASER